MYLNIRDKYRLNEIRERQFYLNFTCKKHRKIQLYVQSYIREVLSVLGLSAS